MREHKPTVYMFLGVPGSGKSYFARNLSEKTGAVRINSDSLRLAIFGSLETMRALYASGQREILNSYVFNSMDYATEQILRQGHDVVYDAHNNKRKDRESLEKIAERVGAAAILIWIKTPFEVALKRGQQRNATADQRQLSEEAMKEVMERHQRFTDEPIDGEKVIVIDGTVSFDEQYAEFTKQLEAINS